MVSNLLRNNSPAPDDGRGDGGGQFPKGFRSACSFAEITARLMEIAAGRVASTYDIVGELAGEDPHPGIILVGLLGSLLSGNSLASDLANLSMITQANQLGMLAVPKILTGGIPAHIVELASSNAGEFFALLQARQEVFGILDLKTGEILELRGENRAGFGRFFFSPKAAPFFTYEAEEGTYIVNLTSKEFYLIPQEQAMVLGYEVLFFSEDGDPFIGVEKDVSGDIVRDIWDVTKGDFVHVNGQRISRIAAGNVGNSDVYLIVQTEAGDWYSLDLFHNETTEIILPGGASVEEVGEDNPHLGPDGNYLSIKANGAWLLLNINTGQTIPISFPNEGVGQVYFGNNGEIYACLQPTDYSQQTSDSLVDLKTGKLLTIDGKQISGCAYFTKLANGKTYAWVTANEITYLLVLEDHHLIELENESAVSGFCAPWCTANGTVFAAITCHNRDLLFDVSKEQWVLPPEIQAMLNDPTTHGNLAPFSFGLPQYGPEGKSYVLIKVEADWYLMDLESNSIVDFGIADATLVLGTRMPIGQISFGPNGDAWVALAQGEKHLMFNLTTRQVVQLPQTKLFDNKVCWSPAGEAYVLITDPILGSVSAFCLTRENSAPTIGLP